MTAQYSSKTLPMLFAGWAMFQAWPYAAFMSDTLLPAQAVSGQSFYEAAWPVSIISFAVCLLAAMSVSARIDQYLSDRRPMVASGFLLIMGTVLIAVSGFAESDPAFGLCVVGAAFTGIGTAFLQLCWQKVLVDIPSNHLALGVPVGYSFSLVLAFGITVAPGMADKVLLVFMIVVSIAVLAWFMKCDNASLNEEASPSNGAALGDVSANEFSKILPSRMVPFTFVLYIVVWFAIEVVESQTASMRVADDPQFIFRALVGIVIALVCVCYDFFFSRSTHTSSAIKVVVLLTGGALVVALSGLSGALLLAYIINYAANLLGCVFLILASVEYSKRMERSTAYFTGLALVPRHIGVSAFALIHLAVPGIAIEPLNTAMLVLLLAVALFVLPHALGGASAASVEETNALEPPLPEMPSTRDDAVCALIAEYGLTRREAEVFELFASGRDSGYIRERLVISRDTVSSHLKHIYAKMGIHSKRELFDLIESRKQV